MSQFHTLAHKASTTGMPTAPRLDLRPGVTEPVVLMVSRRQVEQHDVASLLEELKPFLATS